MSQRSLFDAPAAVSVERPAVQAGDRTYPLAPVICGCGRPIGLYGYRYRSTDVLFYVSTVGFAGPDKDEKVRILDHAGELLHRCTTRQWNADPADRLLLATEREAVYG